MTCSSWWNPAFKHDPGLERPFDTVIARGRWWDPGLDRLITRVGIEVDGDGRCTVRVLSAVQPGWRLFILPFQHPDMATRGSSNGGRRASRGRNPPDNGATQRCGLCGKAGRLTKTECCGQWICDDEGSYVMFSYARNSCSRNHRRYTLCGYHHAAGHGGDWRECRECRDGFEPEIYAHYGTNEYNFVKLQNPPAFEPTLCSTCGERLDLARGGYTVRAGKYACMACTARMLGL